VAAPRLLKPIRSEYASDSDFLDACVEESARYTKSLLADIDRTASKRGVSVDAHTRNAYDEYRKYGRQRTLHDYLAENLDLCERFKREGIGALLDI
jgi:hypothetical protein